MNNQLKHFIKTDKHIHNREIKECNSCGSSKNTTLIGYTDRGTPQYICDECNTQRNERLTKSIRR